VARFRFRLVPVDEGFFTLFSASARNVAEAARRLRELVNATDANEAQFEAIVACEDLGDKHVSELLTRLSTSFVTPFDREDIHALAEELDDVVDDILAVASLIRLVKPSTIIPELREQAEVLVQMADQTADLIDKLESMKDVRGLLDSIDDLESQGDQIHHKVIARLFSGEMEALEVLKWKDIVEAMENALNTLEDISDVVESIVLKHA
jgi:predicted phosphate transport protein (TIGR00153 family)